MTKQGVLQTETCLLKAHSHGTTQVWGLAQQWTGSGTRPPHSSTPPHPQERPPVVGNSYLQVKWTNIFLVTHANHQTIKFHMRWSSTFTKGMPLSLIKICQQQSEFVKKSPSGSSVNSADRCSLSSPSYNFFFFKTKCTLEAHTCQHPPSIVRSR